MSKISVRNLTKKYGTAIALNNVSLEIESGEILVLLGPSGCGKTTLLRCLAGLETPDAGEIIMGDTVVFSSEKNIMTPPGKRNLGMVFQSYALWPHMSVRDNVKFGLDVLKTPKPIADERLDEVLGDVGLGHLDQRYPSELSGGQQQRVALARLLATQPPVFLMDEPLSNLDAKLRNSVRKDIKKLQRDLGITVIYVTHDQTEAMSMADTVVLMKDGHIQQVGTPNDLYSNPNNTFVAEFVGAPPMALIESSILGGFGEDKTIGIRAENIQIVPKGEGRMSCIVNESEFLGAETLIGLDHEGARGLCVLKPGLSMVAEGNEIDINFHDEHLHVFDAAGHRLVR